MTNPLKHHFIVTVIGDLIADELARMRPDEGEQWKRRQWHEDDCLIPKHQSEKSNDSDEIAVDSLERLALAGRVVQFFHMGDSGVEDYLLRRHSLSEWADVVLKSRDIHSQNITVSTSGSTGQPKACEHSWRRLVEEVNDFVGIFNSEYDIAPNRVIALVPSHHIYGFLFTVLLPHVVDIPVLRGFKAYSHVRNGGLRAGDIVVGFPELLTQLATEISPLPSGVLFISSAGCCPPRTLHQLYAMGAARAVEIYGSSETAGIGYRCEPENTYRLLPRWRSNSSDSQQLIEKQSGAVYEMPDKAEWKTINEFKIAGRIDKAISIRGSNVFPARVAELLRQHPAVIDVNVRPMKSDEGTGLKAFIVLNSSIEETTTEQSIKSWLAERLLAAEIPEHISFGKQLPLNSMGKARDWAIGKPVSR
ncbi:AMP-binding protein [Idiomarina ramblicola]|uniref:4-coumarate--CoA ligase n=1 Tax=Idiomarina ramblicola TaxID=263724 RepID=A0A432YUK4_9GAMM|nr:AMP-binding protein [Idiomarina ramblicola]RUO66997.1 4-coumarate--CoA ligase [Idiomarina ramblicola]